MKQIILFDIDYTLFDSDKIKGNIEKITCEFFKIQRKVYDEVYIRYKASLQSSTDFNPESYCKFLTKKFKKESNGLLESFYTTGEVYKNTLYSDTSEDLKELSKNYKLGIFSEGISRYQISKLKFCNLLPYFEKRCLYFFRRKMTGNSIKKLPVKSIVVDDKKEVVETLIDNGFAAIWLNRKNLINVRNIPEISSLEQLPEFLKILYSLSPS